MPVGASCGYRMILSLLRVRDFKVEDMMRSSFSEFASQQQFPELKRKDEQAERMMQELTSKRWPEGCASCYVLPVNCGHHADRKRTLSTPTRY